MRNEKIISWASILNDYIFSGIDDTGLTNNATEIMNYLYGDDDKMISFANQTVKPNPYSKHGGGGKRI